MKCALLWQKFTVKLSVDNDLKFRRSTLKLFLKGKYDLKILLYHIF